MTMKKIRHQLNAIFGVDVSDRKDFLSLQVNDPILCTQICPFELTMETG